MGYNNDYSNVGGTYDRKNNEFALIVVLFILLIIVGTAFMKNWY
ncbi:YjcZ family sporulation protein [Lysinibacillus yapensis]|uniref:YjcZ family sporulation protein n=1 Tax=Ureibacillus yapensis TaxID=2304605 RepID=A0A396S2K4_9BACL|nr:YjcZ family sporulation protein [Lysinibacillus yapensis]RHW31394.1 YjcZ family sporulation protein [Lysinibacillus yapensis]